MTWGSEIICLEAASLAECFFAGTKVFKPAPEIPADLHACHPIGHTGLDLQARLETLVRFLPQLVCFFDGEDSFIDQLVDYGVSGLCLETARR